jgi:hypothetical protein
VQQSSLNLVTADALDVIPVAMRYAAGTSIAASLDALPPVLEAQAAHWRGTAIELDIDLVGHSTRDHQILRIGATAIDTLDLGVRRFFEQLARTGLLGAVNAASLRLLGCETAVSPSGQRTLRTLAAILRNPVYGTCKRLFKSHYSAQGFHPQFRSALIVRPHCSMATSTRATASSRPRAASARRSRSCSSSPQPGTGLPPAVTAFGGASTEPRWLRCAGKPNGSRASARGASRSA